MASRGGGGGRWGPAGPEEDAGFFSPPPERALGLRGRGGSPAGVPPPAVVAGAAAGGRGWTGAGRDSPLQAHPLRTPPQGPTRALARRGLWGQIEAQVGERAAAGAAPRPPDAAVRLPTGELGASQFSDSLTGGGASLPGSVRQGPPASGTAGGAASSALEEDLARAELRASRAEAQLRAVAQELEQRISQQESDSAREIVRELSDLAQSADFRIRALESECARLRASGAFEASEVGKGSGGGAGAVEGGGSGSRSGAGTGVGEVTGEELAPSPTASSSGVALVRQLERQLAEALSATQSQVAQALDAVRQAERNFDLVRVRAEFLETQAALGLGVGVLGASFGVWYWWKSAARRALRR